jgi:recombination protein RecT
MSTNQESLALIVRSDVARERINDVLAENSQQFVATLMSVVNQNIMLKACEPWSVLTAALTAAALDLTIEPSIGYADILPYWDNSDKTKQANGGKSIQKAQFQMRAKGFQQIALRSGQYKKINVTEIRDGEYKGKNHITGDYEFKFYKKEETRQSKKIIGYLSYFELQSGYTKMLYMTVNELVAHAKKYSKQYQGGGGKWADQRKFETTDCGFDSMARKTVMKLNISRNGVTSVLMQKALRADQAVANPDDSFDYVDNKNADKKDDVDQTNPKSDEDVNQEPQR